MNVVQWEYKKLLFALYKMTELNLCGPPCFSRFRQRVVLCLVTVQDICKHMLLFRWTTVSVDCDIDRGIVLISLCNVTTFIYIHSCINFHSQDLVLMMGESGRCVKSSPAHPKDSHWSSGLSGPCGGQSMCDNDVSCSLDPSFSIWARWIVASPSWNMPMPSGIKKKKKSKNLVRSFFFQISLTDKWFSQDHTAV